jgi:hypothetical protein
LLVDNRPRPGHSVNLQRQNQVPDRDVVTAPLYNQTPRIIPPKSTPNGTTSQGAILVKRRYPSTLKAEVLTVTRVGVRPAPIRALQAVSDLGALACRVDVSVGGPGKETLSRRKCPSHDRLW